MNFYFANKKHIKNILPKLFEILYSNMSIISPTNNTFEEDFNICLSYIVPALEDDNRHIVLMNIDNSIVGYFQYNINANSFLMEEIQIKKEFQGIGLFSNLYTWLVQKLPQNILAVEAYVNKHNFKSQSILEKLGLVNSGENTNGSSFYYKGKYIDILNKYS